MAGAAVDCPRCYPTHSQTRTHTRTHAGSTSSLVRGRKTASASAACQTRFCSLAIRAAWTLRGHRDGQ